MKLKTDDPKHYNIEYNYYPEPTYIGHRPEDGWRPIVHTDEQRKKVTLRDLAEGELYWPECTREQIKKRGALAYFNRFATPDEKAYYEQNAANFYEATRPFVLRRNGGRSAFIRDMYSNDLGGDMWGAAVAHVNGGANDFNSAELIFLEETTKESDERDLALFIKNQDEEAIRRFRRQGRILTPSIVIALFFHYPMVDYFLPDDFWDIDQLKIELENAKDLLYAYRQLKERGLDYEAIRGWLKRQEKSSSKEDREKAACVRKSLAVMDHLLTMPENKRFAEWEAFLSPEMQKKGNYLDNVDKTSFWPNVIRMVRNDRLDFETLLPEKNRKNLKEYDDTYLRAEDSSKTIESIPPLKTIKDPKEPTVWCKTVNGLWALLGVVDQTKYPHYEILTYRKKGSNEMK